MDTQILSQILARVGGFVQKRLPGGGPADAGSAIPGLPKTWATHLSFKGLYTSECTEGTGRQRGGVAGLSGL